MSDTVYDDDSDLANYVRIMNVVHFSVSIHTNRNVSACFRNYVMICFTYALSSVSKQKSSKVRKIDALLEKVEERQRGSQGGYFP